MEEDKVSGDADRQRANYGNEYMGERGEEREAVCLDFLN